MTDAAAPKVSRGLVTTLVVVTALAAAGALYLFVVQPLLGAEVAVDDVPVRETPTAQTVQATDPFGGAQGGEGQPDQDLGGAPLPETFEVFTARDPFQQLVEGTPVSTAPGTTPGTTTPGTTTPGTTTPGTTTPGTTTPGTTTPGTTTPGTTTPGTTTPGTTTPGTTTPGTTDGTTTAPSGTRVGTTVIRVVEVSTGDDGVVRASVTVNGEGYTVAVGETFARSFKVLDITGDCTTLLFGDSRFTLCAGEEIRK
jgi:hypothetical protein